MNPTFSVILIAYNQREFAGDAIGSILGDASASLELICVDDGSTDGTGELMDECARRDSRVSVLKMAHSGRPAVARNHGLDRARGQFVCFLDGDDLCHPARFTRLAALLADCPDVDVVLHDYAEFMHGTDPHAAAPRILGDAQTHRRLAALVERPVPGHPAGWMSANALALSQLSDGFTVYTGSIGIRRAHLEARRLRFPADRVYGEDNGLWIAALMDARVVLLHEVLVFWRKHPGSLTSTRSLAAQQAIVASQREMFALVSARFSRAALARARTRMIAESLEVGWMLWNAGDRTAALRSYWRTTLSLRTLAGLRRIAGAIRGPRTKTVA